MQIEITKHDLLPLEEGETLGMPTYRVMGRIDGRIFRINISCEIDGRDCEFENAWGPGDFATNWETHGLVFENLCETESWIKVHQEQCDAYYNS